MINFQKCSNTFILKIYLIDEHGLPIIFLYRPSQRRSCWKIRVHLNRVIGVLTWICHFRSFSSRYTGERCEHLGPSRAGLDWLWALLGISILLVVILTILLTRKKHQNQKKKMKSKSGILLVEQTSNNNIDHQDHNEHADEQNAVESEHIELNNRNSENLIPE